MWLGKEVIGQERDKRGQELLSKQRKTDRTKKGNEFVRDKSNKIYVSTVQRLYL